jgi:hypothetical protein
MSSLVGTTLPRDPASELTRADLRDLRRLVGFMIPAAGDYGVPGADDETIFTDIVNSFGRDQGHVCKALAMLRDLAGEDFAALPDTDAEATAMALLRREGAEVTALGRAVLQCYYRDDRVFRSPARGEDRRGLLGVTTRWTAAAAMRIQRGRAQRRHLRRPASAGSCRAANRTCADPSARRF